MRSRSLLSSLRRFLSRAEIPDFRRLLLPTFALPLLPFRFGLVCFREGDGPSLPELSEQSRTPIHSPRCHISLVAKPTQCSIIANAKAVTVLKPAPFSFISQSVSLKYILMFSLYLFGFLSDSFPVGFHTKIRLIFLVSPFLILFPTSRL